MKGVFMNKKAFTLVELLTTIVIIAFIMGIICCVVYELTNNILYNIKLTIINLFKHTIN